MALIGVAIALGIGIVACGIGQWIASKTLDDQQRQIDDLKRELEEVKRKLEG